MKITIPSELENFKMKMFEIMYRKICFWIKSFFETITVKMKKIPEF